MRNLVLNLTPEPTYCSKHLEHVISINVNAFTVKLTSYKIRLTSDCTNTGITKNHVILANITIITSCNTASAVSYQNIYIYIYIYMYIKKLNHIFCISR